MRPIRPATRRVAARPAPPTRKKRVRSIDPVDLLMNLLKVPGPSGQEAAVQEYVREQLAAAGVPADWIVTDQAQLRSPHPEGVGNLIVQFPGTVRSPRRMFVAHLDTVPLCVGSRPVKRGNWIRSGDRQTGLGADNRAGTAVLLATARRLITQQVPHPPLTFLWTVQEEIGLQGARLIQRSLLGRPRMAFNWDGGSASKVTIGATGGYRMQITVQGKASHAGNAPEKGISAIAIASLAIGQLQQQGWHGSIQHKGKTGTSNIGVIRLMALT
jgi:tripeptide aminopeptidase